MRVRGNCLRPRPHLHAGLLAGLLPFTAHSVGRTAQQLREIATLFDFDSALSRDPTTLADLVIIADPSHLLFRSDSPTHLFIHDVLPKLLRSVAVDASVNVESVCRYA